jgi:hypothetical protein
MGTQRFPPLERCISRVIKTMPVTYLERVALIEGVGSAIAGGGFALITVAAPGRNG